MAVLQTIRNLLLTQRASEAGPVVPAAPTTYEIHPLTIDHLQEVLRLNIRCFQNGENYTRHTFSYLLNEPNTLSYRVTARSGEIVGFVFVMVNDAGAGHLTTIGVAPEHRRRGIGARILSHIEKALHDRAVGTVILEVRVGNVAAQDLYKRCGYSVVQRIENYYVNGEACFLMMKSIL